MRLVRRGRYALLHPAAKGEEFRFSGAAVRLAFDGPAYVGIGVCGHDQDVTETATFADVDLTTKPPAGKPVPYSTPEAQAMNSTDRRVVLVTPGRIEAPNWLRDGKTPVYNGGGRLYRVPAAGGTPEAIDTGFAARYDNHHGVSPDGARPVVSDQPQPDRKSRIHTPPVGGGTPEPVPPTAPSYWHGWPPDGKALAFVSYDEDVVGHPADKDVTLRRMTLADKAVDVLGRFLGGRGTATVPCWSPDGRRVAFVAYQLAP